MNRLHTFLTAAVCGVTLHGAGALALTAVTVPRGDSGTILHVQLGNGGPVGSGPNGQNNGAQTYGSAPSVLNPRGANGGAQPAGGGITTGPSAGTSTGPGVGLRPNSAGQKGNGAKPAPMQANGVRKIN